MLQLMESIREVGIKVPISVFSKDETFVLIDGERRWRCSKRLNMKSVPAIVQPEPAPLENILMMFNIHMVREDWDLIAMAKKIGQVRSMLETQGRSVDPKALSALTGVSLTSVKRSLELLDLPDKYQRMLLKEAEKPKSEQRIKPDLFLEIYKSAATIQKYVPEVFEEVSRTAYVDAMVKKYADRVIDNVVAFRDVSKIARADRAGGNRAAAVPAIVNLATKRGYTIDKAYEDTVESAYERRDLISRITSLTERLTAYRGKPTNDMRSALKELRAEIDAVVSR